MKKILYVIKRMLLMLMQYRQRKMMIGDFKDMIHHNSSLNTSYTEGEEAFINKWKTLSKHVSSLSFRIYSPFIGNSIDIMPSDVARSCIEPILNPGTNINFYNDKNTLSLIIGQENTPTVLCRSMNYSLMDGMYNSFNQDNFDSLFVNHDKVIVKPAKEQGGNGICFFYRDETNILRNENGEKLTIKWLEKNYKTDFLIQECFEQSDYIAQFNPTSVNTIRAITYKDVKTGEIHYMGAVLRIGSKGALIDNATAGGSFIGIDENGFLKDRVFDKYANCTTTFNGIDFSLSKFQIPNYQSVKSFSKQVSGSFPEMRLFALDIVLDKDNTPKCIEVNTQSFTCYFLQLTQGPVFGEYTDDVIEYCKKNKGKLNFSLIQTLKQY